MRGSDFDELAFFRAIGSSGARALLIGRRALVVLGLPVLTADYDFWLHFDDAERFNESVSVFDLVPSHSPHKARQRGRYALENDEHVDVLIARSVPTVAGVVVAFDDLWTRRQVTTLDNGVDVALPSLADLVLTKRFASRPKDLEDELRRKLLVEADRQLSPAEAKAYLDAPISDTEREDVLALNRWFTTRYPTGAERLAYVRRAYLRWTSRG